MHSLKTHVSGLLAVLSLTCLSASPASAAGPADGIFALDPNFDATAPEAPAVTADSLLENERFWPYHVALTETVIGTSLSPDTTLPAEMRGVLIRVEPDGGHVRIDFGRDGRATVPVAQTDVVERANAVRTGAMDKDASNIVFMFAPRLVDPSQDQLMPYRYPHDEGKDYLLMVFADPTDLAFDALVAQFRSLAEHPEVMTVFFPQAQLHDREVRQILRDYDWQVPYLYDHLSEFYTPSLLPDTLEAPAVLLLSVEGRMLFAGSIETGTRQKLDTVLKELFPE